MAETNLMQASEDMVLGRYIGSGLMIALTPVCVGGAIAATAYTGHTIFGTISDDPRLSSYVIWGWIAWNILLWVVSGINIALFTDSYWKELVPNLSERGTTTRVSYEASFWVLILNTLAWFAFIL